MQLLSAHDFEPPVFEGPGYIDIKSSTHIEFTMFAKPADTEDALQRLNQLQEDRYDADNHFRLQALDYQGTDWTCGWTAPRLKGVPKVGFPVTGDLQGMTTHATGPWVATEPSAELVFQPRLELPMASRMVTVATIEGEEIERRHSAGRQVLRLLGSEIRFFYPPSEQSLWVTASTSDALRHPYLENWLSEPLRILLGQPIFPRLRARNFGNGKAFVSLQASPRPLLTPGIAALVTDHSPGASKEMWDDYAAILIAIAKSNGPDHHPSKPNLLTRYHDEVTQATQGSRWVLCMSLASSVEGLVRLLESQPTGSLPVESRLKYLEGQGVITAQARVSWREVRHAVMHGQLVSPWSTRDEDQRIRDLADLLRSLTRELLRRSSGASHP